MAELNPHKELSVSELPDDEKESVFRKAMQVIESLDVPASYARGGLTDILKGDFPKGGKASGKEMMGALFERVTPNVQVPSAPPEFNAMLRKQRQETKEGASEATGLAGEIAVDPLSWIGGGLAAIYRRGGKTVETIEGLGKNVSKSAAELTPIKGLNLPKGFIDQVMKDKKKAYDDIKLFSLNDNIYTGLPDKIKSIESDIAEAKKHKESLGNVFEIEKFKPTKDPRNMWEYNDRVQANRDLDVLFQQLDYHQARLRRLQDSFKKAQQVHKDLLKIDPSGASAKVFEATFRKYADKIKLDKSILKEPVKK